MKKIFYICVLLAGFVSLSAQTAREIMDMSRENSKLRGLEAVSTLIIRDDRGRERVRTTAMASRIFGDGSEKRIIRFLEPPDVRGMGMLIFDHEEKEDDMWVYLPATRKSRRIVASEKSSSFMGSEFAKADMSAPDPSDFTYSLLGEEEIGERTCWKVQTRPVSREKEDEYGFLRKISWVEKSFAAVIRSEYYDFDDSLHKVLQVPDFDIVREDPPRYLITKMQIRNLRNGRSSDMIMKRYDLNPEVPARFFTLSYLENP